MKTYCRGLAIFALVAAALSPAPDAAIALAAAAPCAWMLGHAWRQNR